MRIQSLPIGLRIDACSVKTMTLAWAPLRPAVSRRLVVIGRQHDANREALRLAQPARGGLDVRQLAGRRLVALGDAPADALDASLEDLARAVVEGDQHPVAGRHDCRAGSRACPPRSTAARSR